MNAVTFRPDPALLHRPALTNWRPARTRSPAIAIPSACCCGTPAHAAKGAPANLRIEDIDAELGRDFLTHVETHGVIAPAAATPGSPRSDRSSALSRWTSLHAMHCQRILAMPSKRYVKRTVDFIDRRRWQRCWRRPIRHRRWPAGSCSCCSWRCRRAFGSRS